MWDLGSLTRDQTCVPCIERQILNHWTTRKVCKFFLTSKKLTEIGAASSQKENLKRKEKKRKPLVEKRTSALIWEATLPLWEREVNSERLYTE